MIDGWEVLDEIEKVGSCYGKTSKPVIIKDCGEIKTPKIESE